MKNQSIKKILANIIVVCQIVSLLAIAVPTASAAATLPLNLEEYTLDLLTHYDFATGKETVSDTTIDPTKVFKAPLGGAYVVAPTISDNKLSFSMKNSASKQTVLPLNVAPAEAYQVQYKINLGAAAFHEGFLLSYTDATHFMTGYYDTASTWYIWGYKPAEFYPTFTGPTVTPLTKDTEYDVTVTYLEDLISVVIKDSAGTVVVNKEMLISGMLDTSAGPPSGLNKIPGLATNATGSDFDFKISDIKYFEIQNRTDVPVNITGKITGINDAPLANMKVTIGSKTTTTSLDGTYSIPKIYENTYDLTVTGDRYKTHTEKYTVASTSSIKNIKMTHEDWAIVDGKAAYRLTGTLIDANGTVVANKNVILTPGNLSAITNAQGAFEIKGVIAGNYNLNATESSLTASKAITVVDKSIDAGFVQFPRAQSGDNLDTLTSGKMTVYIDKKFPRVDHYVIDGKNFNGQFNTLTSLIINGATVQPTVTYVKNGSTAEYKMGVRGTSTSEYGSYAFDATLTSMLIVKDNTLEFTITKVENNKDNNSFPIQTIEVPNHNLVSVNNNQPGANFAGARMSNDTTTSGDTFLTADQMSGKKAYNYAILSNNEVSASIFSNSDEGTNGSNARVTAETIASGTFKTVGLRSSYWFYNRKITPNSPLIGSKSSMFLVENPIELPSVKVVLTLDCNNDGKVDWNDGAIATRDIMNTPVGSEDVPELLGYRVVQNFISQADYPFTTVLDNIKKVALSTDGLGQSIIIKGFNNEGHDSGHVWFSDIGVRQGGEKEFQNMLKGAKDYAARIGVHINTGEMYPESKSFSENMIRTTGPTTKIPSYGWSYVEIATRVDGRYDHISGERQKRLQALKDIVGNDLDFIYLDIWGNATSGVEDAWDTHYVAKQINDLGWRFTSEWGYMFEYGSTFQHWAGDMAYGSSGGSKGHNSAIMRFIRNHQRDSWIAEWTPYGGAAVAPLLGGLSMRDFEAWQGRFNYDTYITNLYSNNLIGKFLQHYEVTKMEFGNETTIAGSKWTPEMKVSLGNKAGDKVQIERLSNDYVAAPKLYRSRNITLNGKLISTGEVAYGNDASKPGTEKYLLPWFWDPTTGEAVSTADEKLYHWNALGGTSTWDLPTTWSNLANVKVYKLTELGRVDMVTVNVVGGKITLTDILPGTPYVVYRGEATKLKLSDITWSVGTHLTDVAFNSGSLTHWQKTGNGTAEIIKTARNKNTVLKLDNEVALTQNLTNLIAGQKYVAYVTVNNASDALAWLQIKSNGTTLASNYTAKSFLANTSLSAQHIGDGNYHNMFVFFTAPASGTTTLTLSREAGTESTYFDDIRVYESKSDTIKAVNSLNHVTEFVQDFENVPQGIYPFVISNNYQQVHLSELNAPFTQAGWSAKKMDDALDGQWSVKSYKAATRNSVLYQTLPQTLRFEPGQVYDVSLDYQAGSADAFELVVGDGGSASVKAYPLEKSLGSTTSIKVKLTASASGNTWIGIKAKTTVDYEDVTGEGDRLFGGYMDVVVDNLVVKADESKSAEIKPAAYTFASGEVGKYTVTPQSFAVKNIGSGTITSLVAALSSMDFEVTEVLTPSSLSANQVATIKVAPKAGLAAGTYNANLTVTGSNGVTVTSTLSFTVTTASTYIAAIDPTTYNFGSVLAGSNTATAKEFKIKNTGTGTINSVSAALSTTDFVVTTALSKATLSANEEATISIAPKADLAVGTYNANLTVTGSNGVTVTSTLSFTVTNTITYSAEIDPMTFSFETGLAGEYSATAKEFKIRNTGTGSITSMVAELNTTDFNVTTGLSKAALSANEEATISIAPKAGLAAGTYNANLTVTGNDGISVKADLTFVVTMPTQATYTLEVSPIAFNYGSFTVGYSEITAKEMTITNTGSGTLTSLTASVDSDKFVIATNFAGVTLNPGATATFAIAPKTGLLAGYHSTVLTVSADNNATATSILSLTVNNPTTTTPTTTPTPTPTPNPEVIKEVTSKITAPTTEQVAEATKATDSLAESSAKAGVEIKSIAPAILVDIPSGNKGAVITKIKLPNTVDTTKITTLAKLNSDGTLTPVPTKVDAVTGEVKAIISEDSTLVPVSVKAVFEDINNNPMKAVIEKAASALIVSGVGNSKFEPNNTVDTAQVTSIFLRTLGIGTEANAPAATGVDQDKWYSKQMNTAVSHGIIAEEMNADSVMSRMDTATLIVKAMEQTGIKTKMTAEQAKELLKGFSDLATLSEAKSIDMAKCVKLGIFNGYGNGKMGPDDSLLRAQVASLAVTLQNAILMQK